MAQSRQYAEERHARALDRRLKELATQPEFTTSIEGEGVHWHCTATLPPFRCTLHCFDNDGAEFLVSFEASDDTLAAGRTHSQDEAVAAVRAWLAGRPLDQMYAGFAFIDQTRRSLAAILARTTELYPGMEQITNQLQRTWGDQHELHFLADERSCRLYYYGDNNFPTASFQWDECELFTVETNDVDTLAHVLKRWLSDRAMPSVMRLDFPWLGISDVADAYEQGRGVEGEFMASWDSITEFYEGSTATPDFIARMRESGFDRTLRVGQSMFTMIVSRARRHGLRGEQSYIAFDFNASGIVINCNIEGESEQLTTPDYEFTPEIMALLERLEETPID